MEMVEIRGEGLACELLQCRHLGFLLESSNQCLIVLRNAAQRAQHERTDISPEK